MKTSTDRPTASVRLCIAVQLVNYQQWMPSYAKLFALQNSWFCYIWNILYRDTSLVCAESDKADENR